MDEQASAVLSLGGLVATGLMSACGDGKPDNGGIGANAATGSLSETGNSCVAYQARHRYNDLMHGRVVPGR
jgi:hypothetical protein